MWYPEQGASARLPVNPKLSKTAMEQALCSGRPTSDKSGWGEPKLNTRKQRRYSECMQVFIMIHLHESQIDEMNP